MALIGEDCHFFISSTCTRGNQCAFRHQPAARITEVTCPDWIKGNCLKPTCGLRHVPVDRTNRKNIPCYYDSQPSGCLKPNCQYVHTKKAAVSVGVSVAVPTPVTPASAVHSTSANPPVHQPVQMTVKSDNKPLHHIKEPQLPKITPPSVPPVQPVIVRPSLINGVLHLPTRGILGAPPPTQVVGQPPQPVLMTQNGVSILSSTPQLVQQPMVAQGNQPTQAPVVNTLNRKNEYPKSAHFNEQVRLFKEMLSNKHNNNQKQKDNKDYYDDSPEEEEEARKYKDRQRNHKSKKSKKASRGKKKSRDGWMDKADEEVLYNDYKDIPLGKKSKRNKNEKHTDSDSDINVKSYEEILREKALRKLMEKRKAEQFSNDFDDILSADKNKKPSKKYSSDGDETVDTKHKHRKPKRESIDLENEVFSQEDAVELEIDNDEFSIETESDKYRRKYGKDGKRKSSKSSQDVSKDKEHKSKSSDEKKKTVTMNSSNSKQSHEDPEEKSKVDEKKNEPVGVPESPTPTQETSVMIIPDETTDINFSVDEDDDLALELNNEKNNEQDKTKTKKDNSHRSSERSSQRSTKKVASVVSFVGKKPNVAKSSGKKNDNSSDTENSGKPKRKIMVIDSAPTDQKKTKEDTKTQLEKKKVISLSGKRATEKMQKSNDPQPKNEIKIKTFEEIMAEKRKRKFQDTDVVLVSDNETNPNLDSPIKRRSEAIKSKVLTVRKDKNEDVAHEEKKEIPAPPKTAAQLRREKLRQAKEEYEKRRKSQQLYRPKQIPTEEKESTEIPKNTNKTVSSAATVIESKKIKLSRVPVANSAESSSGTDKVTVRSFQEIMEEKRMRKQQQQNTAANLPQRSKIDSKPIQSFLRRASGKEGNTKLSGNGKTVDKKTPTSAPSPTELATSPNNTSADSSIPNEETSQDISVSDEKTLPLDSPKLAAPIKLKRFSASENDLSPASSSGDRKKSSSSDGSAPNGSTEASPTANQETTPADQLPGNNTTEPSMEAIKEALDEKKRSREEDILSDDEFEKEMNFLSDDDENNDGDDVDDDDFMMELQQMIDS